MKTQYLSLMLSLSFAACVAGQAPPVYQATAPAAATAAPPPSAAPKYSAADLEKLAAPIALHPDPLIAILLPASVYPLEIVQAARFVKDTNNLARVDEQPWDENVRALAKFPTLIQQMNDDLTWTMDLGQAFLEQQTELMDTIQRLRGKANAAGVLQTTPQQVIYVTNTVVERTVEQQVVYMTNTVVQIQPANPQVVYVPTYPPTIYYPAPYYVGPPPVVSFAVGVTVGLIIANNCDWHGGGIYVGHHGVAVWGGGGYHGDVNVNRNININNTTINNINRPAAPAQKWQPDQSRLRTTGAPGSMASARSAEARGWGSSPVRPTPSIASARPSVAPAVSRPSASPSVIRPAPSAAYNRPAASPSYARPTPSAARGSAFGGISSGASTRQSSSRGSFSRGGGRSFGGRRR